MIKLLVAFFATSYLLPGVNSYAQKKARILTVPGDRYVNKGSSNNQVIYN